MLTRRAANGIRRLRKRLEAVPAFEGPPLTALLVGCHRSGTTMLGEVIERPAGTWVFHEHQRRAFDDFRIRDADTVRVLVEDAGRPVVAFKPINDAQWADRLLDAHDPARLVWIHRHHADVARSAVVKWGEHQREVVDAIARRDLTSLGWRGERLSDEALAAVDRAHRPNLTPLEGAALFWVLRNRIWFDRDLGDEPRAMLVRYEDVRADPVAAFEPVFRFLGLPFSTDDVAMVRRDDRPARPLEGIHPDVAGECERMEAALSAAHQGTAVGG